MTSSRQVVPELRAIPEQMICVDEHGAWKIPSGKAFCPGCKEMLEPDSEYPDDLLCGKCERAFDAATMEEIPWNP